MALPPVAYGLAPGLRPSSRASECRRDEAVGRGAVRRPFPVITAGGQQPAGPRRDVDHDGGDCDREHGKDPVE